MTPATAQAASRRGPFQWAKVIDHTSCIGCHACTTACKSENAVPVGVTRTYVKAVDVGVYPETRRALQVTRCNQCRDAPCVTACPTSAMFRRPDGIVDFAKNICIGCKACMAACPYDAIFINPDDRSAEKCNFCAHRIDMGLEPACVVVCPVEAIIVGDLNDPASGVARAVQRENVAVRRPEKQTNPNLFYKGAHTYTLDPLAARRPDGALFMWSEQQRDRLHPVVSGSPTGSSSAAALLSYDIGHHAPWGWKVSLYTWTKSLSAGVYLAGLLLVLTGSLSWRDVVWTSVTPLLALLFLAITGALLVGDLTHPARFYMIFTRPQWRSWLVKGGFILLGYGAVAAVHLVAGVRGLPRVVSWLAAPGLPLAVMTACYTAFLLAQARGRDLWQSAVLPVHLIVQALVAGSAILLVAGAGIEDSPIDPLNRILSIASMAHLLCVWAEAALAHGTPHAQHAVREMVRGRFGLFFWAAVACAGVSVAAPWLGSRVALVALAGLAAYEHAYVQAGQAVPLA